MTHPPSTLVTLPHSSACVAKRAAADHIFIGATSSRRADDGRIVEKFTARKAGANGAVRPGPAREQQRLLSWW
eukprot:2049641-Prymnesium_polylepis.2